MHSWYSKCNGHKVRIHTNLDLHRTEDFGGIDFPCIPRVGEDIQSNYIHTRNGACCNLELKVCQVRYAKNEVHVEVHVPSPYKTLKDFYDWYERLTGWKFI